MGFFDRFRRKSIYDASTGPTDASQWRRIYYPLIERYSFLGGVHMEHAKLTNSKFNPIGPLAVLLKEYWSSHSQSEIQALLVQWKRQFDNCEQQGLVIAILMEIGASKGAIRGEELAKIVVARMLEPENYNGYFVRYVIGQAIEHEAGPNQKRMYWKAVVTREIV